MARLKEFYESKLKAELQEKFSYKNRMQVPHIEKIVLNMGIGEAVRDKKLLVSAAQEMAAIAGQKPIITKARNSIAGFKLREEMGIGVKVTLRKDRMYEFLDRLVNIALPRVRDFRGISRKRFDGRGNFALGIKEHIIFPEVDFDKVEKVRGLDIVIVTSARTDKEACALLEGFNMPFMGGGQKAA